MTDDLLARYLTVNSSYGRPFIFKLTQRGFYSEVNNFLNAVIFGLSKGRRLIVDESGFEGLRWMDFFTASLPDAPEEVIRTVPADWIINGSQTPRFHKITGYAERRNNRRLPIWLPSLGLFGSYRQIKRQFAEAFTTPHVATRLPASPYAALHIRRGDKIVPAPDLDADGHPIVWPPEGEHTPTETYLRLLRAKGPDIRTIFVMTDDYTTVEELRSIAPAYEISTLCKPEERGYRQLDFSSQTPAVKAEKLHRLLAETQIAIESDVFLGGFKSNVARFIALRHEHPDQCYSVDEQKTWHPK